MTEVTLSGYADCSPADRLLAIEQLGALLSATTSELLQLVAVSNQAEDWKIDGATAMGPWLVAALRVSSGTAREWVDVATALLELPSLRDAFDEGMLSWEQLRPATRYATPDSDTTLADELPGCSVAQIEAEARRRRPRKSEEEREAARRTRFTWRSDPALGGYRYSGFLPTDRGERLNLVLTRHAEAAGPEPETGVWAPFDTRAADALCDLTEAEAATDHDREASLVVIHATSKVVDGHEPGNGMVGDLPISRESVLRHLCDCKIEYSIDGPGGVTVGIGRADRNVPRWLRRRIARRDGTCRFPGCSRTIRHRHHIQHWTHGGPTDSWNLIGTCWQPHHLVHEGGWSIEGDADGELTFISPDGRRRTSRPLAIRPDVRRRARSAAGLPPGPPTRNDAGPAPP